MFAKLKCFVIFVQLLVTLITYRPFGSVIFDVNERYDELSHNLLLQRIESSPHISRQLRLRALGVMKEPTQPSSTAGMLPLPQYFSTLLLLLLFWRNDL